MLYMDNILNTKIYTEKFHRKNSAVQKCCPNIHVRATTLTARKHKLNIFFMIIGT